jgi:hypothetical protein
MGQAQPDLSAIFDNVASDWPTLADLPPRRHARWMPHQKKIVVLAVRSGLLALHQAMERYELSIEEFQSWNRQFSDQPYAHALRDYRKGKFAPISG